MKDKSREMKVGGGETHNPQPSTVNCQLSTLTPQLSTLNPAVRSKLAALRRRIRRYVWLEGVTAAVAWLGVAFWASLAVDWLFEPPRAVRALVLGIVGLGLAWVLFRWILRRAFVRLSDRNMAMLIERHFPQFDESLLTAVELTEEGRGARRQETAPLLPHPSSLTSHPSPHGREMLAQTCRRAAEPIGEVRLGEVFNPAPLRMSTAAAVLLAAGVWAFSALAPEAFGTWTQRSLLLDDQLWPRKTRLVVEGFEDGVGKVARGSDLEVIAKADLSKPVVPKVVEVRYQTEGGARQRAAMSREGTADPAREKFQAYSHTFRGVLEPIRFDVVGGDAAVRDLRIEVVDSPTIVQMVLVCRFPDYMDRPSSPLSVTGVMQLPVGTGITVQASANKDLVKVEVDEGRGMRGEGRGARGEGRSGTLTPRASPLTPCLSPTSPCQSFTLALPDFKEDTTLRFTLFDTDGIKSREPVRLVLAAIADEAPKLSVELRGIGSAITPQARLPVAGPITDDYGIARVWFDYSIDEEARRTRDVRSTSGNPTEIALDDALEVRDLELTPGQKLLVFVKAADRYDLAEAPNVGASRQWLLDVVTPEQLRTKLEARELVLRQRFERIAQEVTETRDSLLRVDFAAQSGDRPQRVPEAEDALSPQRLLTRGALRAERASQNSRKNAHEILGLVEAFFNIRDELINNRIDTPELTSRLERGIADPLQRIANEMFPELDRRLDRLEATLADDRLGPENRDLAIAQVDAIRQAIQNVLDQMLKMEDFNKVVELLREIIHAQERLSDQTQSRHKQKLRELLEDAASAEAGAAASNAPAAEPSSADRLSVRQQQVADNFQHLQELLLRMAELSEMTDPRRAALLRKAVHESEQRLIAVEFDSLVDLLEKDRLSRAIQNQNDLQQDLRALLELLLSENRARRIDSEKARVREYLKRLNQIIKQQKGIQGRTAGSGPPASLADQQQKLADNTGDLADDIQRNEEPARGLADKPKEAGSEEQKPDGGEKQAESPKPGQGGRDGQSPPQSPEQDRNPARPRIESAENRMREAHKKLEEAQREGAVKEQEEAIRELERAKAELEEILRQLREEEIERTLTLLEARLQKMLDMQREVNEGTLRLEKIPQPERTHNHEIEASRLGRQEAQIVLEADKALALLRDDGTAVAVPEALEQVREDMREVVRRLDRAAVGPITQTIEEEIVAALEEMIEAFQQARQEAEEKRTMPMPPGQPQDQALVDLLAEIKMVRAMQMRVNRRTQRYAKLIDGEQAENADLLEALDRLAERQQRIHQITRDLDQERSR